MSLFFKLNEVQDKESGLLATITCVKNSEANHNVYFIDFNEFKKIPGSPFSYWVVDDVRRLFGKFEPFECAERTAKVGLSTGNDFRFLRNWWEVPYENKNWVPFPKGGPYSPFYTTFPMVVNWTNEIKVSPGSVIRNKTYYGKPGITWPLRARAFSPQAMPENSIFSVRGYSAFVPKKQLLVTLAIFNSNIFDYVYKTALGRFGYPEFIVGILQFLPWPKFETAQIEVLADTAEKIWKLKYKADLNNEKSQYYVAPSAYLSNLPEYGIDSDIDEYRKLIEKIDEICLEGFGLNECIIEDRPKEKVLLGKVRSDLEEVVSWCFGFIFGRYKKATEIKSIPLAEPFEELPQGPYHPEYDKTSPVIYEDYLGCTNGIIALVENYIHELDIQMELEVTPYIRDCFFSDHLAYFSENKRDVCLYWPLQTPSSSYTLWVYYHHLNEQTIYACVNDFVQPKLERIEQDLNTLRGKSARSTQEENELEKLSDLTSELRDFRDELLRLAKFWKPNLNDGVQITAAPLWKLFKHKAWQKKLKETWEKLEKGDYDWAHLACSIWPERVLRKCHQDRSLAIAHDVENTFWHEVKVPVMRGKKATGETKLEWQPKELTDDELDALIQAKIKETRT